MPDTVIRFDSVSKQFKLSLSRPRTVQEVFLHLLAVRRDHRRETFWAVRDATFDISQGETVGLIGANGAGKSTVLKLASRIIYPTAGQVDVHGRIGALLELGTGFHPDLTGRENIYLNGSLMGLGREDMRGKLDAIIAFSELGSFIDMPVKHYSSGMYMRLGFSTAVHVDPDILLVDEVLAVGDQAFQQKCQKRVARLAKSGATILFVSHSLDAVRSICQRAIWMEDGRVHADGDTDWVAQLYADHTWNLMESRLRAGNDIDAPVGLDGELQRWGSHCVEINGISLLDAKGSPCLSFATAEPLRVRIHYTAHQRIANPVFGLAIYRSDGLHLTGPNTQEARLKIPFIEGSGWVEWVVDSLPLLAGQYDVSVAVYDHALTHAHDHHHRMYSFLVRGAPTPAGLFDFAGTWEAG